MSKFRAIRAALAVSIILTATLGGCDRRAKTTESGLPISSVPPRDGKPIDQATVLPEREKIILKKPPAP